MARREIGKLVRDQIPDIIRLEGKNDRTGTGRIEVYGGA